MKPLTTSTAPCPITSVLAIPQHNTNADIISLLPPVHFNTMYMPVKGTVKKKNKAIPLQAWTGPEGSRRIRLPDFKTIGT